MLQSIHDNAKGWIAYFIVILISVPFALWGIQQYLGGGGDNIVAVVNGEDISLQAVQNEVSQQRQRIASMFGKIPPGFNEKALRKSALESLISRTLLEQHAREQGYRASSQEVLNLIKSIPQFQKDGKFDADLYKQVLKAQGRSPASLEQQLRESLTLDQFTDAITATAFLPKSEMQHYQSLAQQKRDIEVYTLKLADVLDDIKISNEMINAEYKAHPELYQTDEQVKVAYVELNETDISKRIEVNDELLQAYYDENSDLYFSKAKFKMSHIKVSITDKQTAEQAQQKADALYKELSSGAKTFKDIAASADGEQIFAELGDTGDFLPKGTMDAVVEDAIFSASVGDIIKPIKAGGGYEIIKLIDRVDAHQIPFTEAKADVEKDYRRKKTAEQYEDMLEELRTTAFENDGSLQPAADAIGAEIKTTDFFSRKSGTGLAANPKVVSAAFNPEVLTQGVNSPLIELSDSQAIVLRLDAHKSPELKPLSDVRETIVNNLKQQQGRKLLKEKVDTLLAELRKTGNWDSLGEAASQIEKYQGITREGDSKVPPYIVQNAFKLALPADGKAVYGGVQSPQGDYSIIALTAVKDGDTKLDEQMISQYSSYIGNREQMATLKALREQADVEIYQQRLDSQ